MSETILLEKYELYMASCVGVRRQTLSFKESKQYNRVKQKDYGWHTEIEAACAEVASAKYLETYWDGSVGTGKAPDLKPDVQVRHTHYDSGKLVVRTDDNKEERYILVTGNFPSYKIRGWIYGYEAVKDEYWENPNDAEYAWFVPQDVLRPIQELKLALAKERHEILTGGLRDERRTV